MGAGHSATWSRWCNEYFARNITPTLIDMYIGRGYELHALTTLLLVLKYPLELWTVEERIRDTPALRVLMRRFHAAARDAFPPPMYSGVVVYVPPADKALRTAVADFLFTHGTDAFIKGAKYLVGTERTSGEIEAVVRYTVDELAHTMDVTQSVGGTLLFPAVIEKAETLRLQSLFFNGIENPYLLLPFCNDVITPPFEKYVNPYAGLGTMPDREPRGWILHVHSSRSKHTVTVFHGPERDLEFDDVVAHVNKFLDDTFEIEEFCDKYLDREDFNVGSPGTEWLVGVTDDNMCATSACKVTSIMEYTMFSEKISIDYLCSSKVARSADPRYVSGSDLMRAASLLAKAADCYLMKVYPLHNAWPFYRGLGFYPIGADMEWILPLSPVTRSEMEALRSIATQLRSKRAKPDAWMNALAPYTNTEFRKPVRCAVYDASNKELTQRAASVMTFHLGCNLDDPESLGALNNVRVSTFGLQCLEIVYVASVVTSDVIADTQGRVYRVYENYIIAPYFDHKDTKDAVHYTAADHIQSYDRDRDRDRVTTNTVRFK